jgi:hypothetical protein
MSRHSKREKKERRKVIFQFRKVFFKANAWTAMKTGTKAGRYKSASMANITQYGRNFYHSFVERELLKTRRGNYSVFARGSVGESPIELALAFNRGRACVPMAYVRIGFEKKAIVIEAMKGASGFKAELNKFNEANSKKAFDTILEQMEAHARTLGFEEAKIRIPESLFSYWASKQYGEVKSAQIKKRMRELYNRVARANGYRKKGLFLVKVL